MKAQFSIITCLILVFGFAVSSEVAAQKASAHDLVNIFSETKGKPAIDGAALDAFGINPMTLATIVITGKIDLSVADHRDFFVDSLLPLSDYLDESSHERFLTIPSVGSYDDSFGHPSVHRQNLNYAMQIIGALGNPTGRNNESCSFPVSNISEVWNVKGGSEANFGLSDRIGVSHLARTSGSVDFVLSHDTELCNPDLPVAMMYDDGGLIPIGTGPRKNGRCCTSSGDELVSDACDEETGSYCRLFRTGNGIRKCSDSSDACGSGGNPDSILVD